MSLPAGHLNTERAAAASVGVISRAELAHCRSWQLAFARERKDHRYYEIVEDTVRQGFQYRYFAIRDAGGEMCAVQPFFILDQDILVGVSPRIGALIEFVRR
ncbi:MAG TPA: GNAT family N-acetyltransferase, partial [Xanthobacteraceae bacterium]|nr:GNAT family N-acetyltransferase [Xanthobacteraceae bacterium]